MAAWLIVGGIVAVIVIIVIIIVVVMTTGSSSSETAPATGPIVAPTDGTTPVAPVEAPIVTPQPLISPTERSYEFHADKDATWQGREDAIGVMPFHSLEESKRVCDAISDCRAFVRYRGNSYYRPSLNATPVAWGTASTFPDDGTYVATPATLTPGEPRRKYTFQQGQDAMWAGRENALGIAAFRTADESKRVCDAMAGCAGFVRYGGKAYYRPSLAATPTVWGAAHPTATFPDDGTYVPS